jgi:type II secretory pathway component PulF
MNTEELAFINRQLAGMLKAGIPLEAGLKKITESMSDSKLKAQLDELGDRLEKGQAVEQAADGLDLPETYKRLLALGQDGQNMPKVLTCVADYYERVGTLATRLKGLAIYPMMILVCGLLVTGLMAYLSSILRADLIDISQDVTPFSDVYQSGALSAFPVGVFGTALLFYIVVLRSQKMRRYFSWKIPMLRDAALAQYAALTEALLASGTQLPEALGMVRKLETGSPLEIDLAAIEQRLAEGQGSYAEAANDSKTIPGFFNWIVGQADEDITAGFAHARTIYASRAENRMQSFLYCFLPVNILVIGLLLLSFFVPHFSLLLEVIKSIDSIGGF